jgi:3-oxoacyl-[acyl-carrier protein] reductase
MPQLLKDKTVLITGSGRGVGAVLAEAFASEGASIIINYLSSRSQAEDLANRLRNQYDVPTLAIGADITIPEEAQRLVEETVEMAGSLDVLVNNALASYSFNPERRKWAWEMEWADYEQQLNGTLKGAYHMCQASLPFMKQQHSGKIINMLTNLIHQPIIPYHDYTTAKTALLGFSRNLAADVGMFGIQVNCVAPGLIYPTPASQPTKEEVRDKVLASTPLKRIARPEDIAGTVLYLASPWSDFVTGQCITVDGGLTMN